MELDFVDLDNFLLQHNGRLIHQVWFGTIPNRSEAKKTYKKWKIYRDSWLIKNPTWFRMEWSKELCIELVKTFFPEHNEMFRNYKYEIQRCDAVRYLILYRYGGVYADMDMFCCRPFDEALKEYTNDIYLVQSPNGMIIQSDDHVSNSLMYSKPRHPFWKQLMLELEKHQRVPIFYTKHLTVMMTTGPGIVNRVYTKYKYQYLLKSFPYQYFHPYGISDEVRLTSVDPAIFTVHVSQGSWSGKDTEMINFVVREWQILVFILSVYVLLFILIRRIR